MATYYHKGSVFVRMFNGDHNPPHVHIWTPDGEARVDLRTLTPMDARLSKHDYEVAMGWVRDNIDFLRAEWERLNG